jgi:SAM-dependent methyltransferase
MTEDYFNTISHIPHFYMIRMIESRLMSDYIDKNEGPFLDLGCGDGTFSMSLKLNNIYAIDIDANPVKNIKDDGYYQAVHIASASSIPFHDSFFMTVFSNCALEHMDSLDDIFYEVRRVLKHNGKFIFTVPTEQFFKEVRSDKILQELGLNNEESIRKYNEFHHHVNIFDIPSWIKELEASGFNCLKYEYYLPKPIGAFVARMDVLYSIGSAADKHLITKLEEEFNSTEGSPLRHFFERYLVNPHIELSGTHIIIKAVRN